MTNRIRVRPLPVEVPDGEPFKNDLLDRKPFAGSLAATLGGIEGPGVFAIDGQCVGQDQVRADVRMPSSSRIGEV